MRYEVKLHARVREVTIYRGNDEMDMFSHIYAVVSTLETTRQSAEIEVIKDGQSEWIEYDKGRRRACLMQKH